MSPETETSALAQPRGTAAALALIMATLAGGMAWGIRGQYGHETGAMIFGILVGFVVVLNNAPNATATKAARAIGFFTLAIGFGGSMTYGQTVGLTMDTGVHGNLADPRWNAAAWRWGMLGLAIKGGLWIGFGGAFLGMGLGSNRYSPLKMAVLGLGLIAAFFLGRWLINEPFDPANRILPRLYFSDHWQWEASENVKPRREVWGGLLVGFALLMAWLAAIERDRLAVNLGLWGVAGGLGFPFGQWFQASLVWNPERFQRLSWWHIGVNSWNMMEVTFGMTAGLLLAIGCHLNRRRIVNLPVADEFAMSSRCELWMIAAYVHFFLLGWYFENSAFVAIHQYGVVMGLLPMVAIAGGRYAPFLFDLPIVALSIVVKTWLARYRQADFETLSVSLLVASAVLGLSIEIALRCGMNGGRLSARRFAGFGLPFTATLYFASNFVFFSLPWNWFADARGYLAWKHSGAIYVIGWAVLSLGGLYLAKPGKRMQGS